MAQRQIKINEQGYPIVPFHYPYNLYEHFVDEASFVEDVNRAWGEYDQVSGALRHGEPNYLDKRYSEGVDDRRYQSDLRMWEATMAQEAVYQAHKPTPQRGPVDRDFLALSSRDKTDQKTAAEILRNRAFVDEQSKLAIQRQALGDEKGAREATARSAMMVRQIEQQRKDHKYTFVEEADRRLVEDATRELEEATKLDPSTVEANREYYQGLATSFNATHDGHFSYLIDDVSPYDQHRTGESRIIKVEHGGLRACDVARTAENRNMTTLDHLINTGYGMTNPKAEVEETAKETPKETPSQEEWEGSLKAV